MGGLRKSWNFEVSLSVLIINVFIFHLKVASQSYRDISHDRIELYFNLSLESAAYMLTGHTYIPGPVLLPIESMILSLGIWYACSGHT